jgi:hypothetical protein
MTFVVEMKLEILILYLSLARLDPSTDPNNGVQCDAYDQTFLTPDAK